jgi:hypothetical protein
MKFQSALAAAGAIVGILSYSSSASAFTDIFGNMCSVEDLVPLEGNPDAASQCPTVFAKRLNPDREYQIARALLGYPPAWQTYEPGLGWEDDDPMGSFSSTHNNAPSITSSSGAVGQGISSKYTDGEVGADAHLNLAKKFNLGNQSLAVGAFFSYDSRSITFGSDGVLASVASAHRNIYTIGARTAYAFGDMRLDAALAYMPGNGHLTDNATGGEGSFSTHGYFADVGLYKVFNLFGSTVFPERSLPTKAPPKPVSTNSLNLLVGGHLGYVSDRANGFTDNTGFIYGGERLSYGNIGALARLYATVPSGDMTWKPFVQGTLDQRFSYTHTLDVIAQGTLAADQLSFGDARTFWGTQLGIDVLHVSGISVGINGFYEASADQRTIGGAGYIKFPLMSWLGVYR